MSNDIRQAGGAMAAGPVPRHVAVIMDGNGRWARNRGLPRIEGHRAGAETVRRVVECCHDLGIEYLTLYAFSTENWRRPRDEVSQLMHLLRDFLRQQLPELNRQDIRLNVIGNLAQLPGYARKEVQKALRATSANQSGTLTLALSYGSRDEIVNAARRLAAEVAAGVIRPEAIDEQSLAAALYTADLPDPDLLIRTSGELRISNFLLWQLSYAELWFTTTLWPDFSKEEFAEAIADYGRRRRRFGAVDGGNKAE
jgi:undecaprenyl diphosphate synthase